jgi:hypothetical protein
LHGADSSGSAPPPGFDYGWIIGVVIIGVVIIVACVLIWFFKNKRQAQAPEELSYSGEELWMENPETIQEDNIYQSVYVESHDETLFVRMD